MKRIKTSVLLALFFLSTPQAAYAGLWQNFCDIFRSRTTVFLRDDVPCDVAEFLASAEIINALDPEGYFIRTTDQQIAPDQVRRAAGPRQLALNSQGYCLALREVIASLEKFYEGEHTAHNLNLFLKILCTWQLQEAAHRDRGEGSSADDEIRRVAKDILALASTPKFHLLDAQCNMYSFAAWGLAKIIALDNVSPEDPGLPAGASAAQRRRGIAGKAEQTIYRLKTAEEIAADFAAEAR